MIDTGPKWTCIRCEPCFCPQLSAHSYCLQCRHQDGGRIPHFDIFQIRNLPAKLEKGPCYNSSQSHIHQLEESHFLKCVKFRMNPLISKIRNQNIRFLWIRLQQSSQAQRLPSISLCEKQAEIFLLLACPVFWPTPRAQSFFSFLGEALNTFSSRQRFRNGSAWGECQRRFEFMIHAKNSA